jgi:hypothetical protein
MCKYSIPWVGQCKNDTPKNQMFCKEHLNMKCSICGEQAVKGCDSCHNFVCGYPVCDNCKHCDSTF